MELLSCCGLWLCHTVGPCTYGKNFEFKICICCGYKRAYYAMHWRRIRGLSALAGVRLRAMKRGSEPSHGPLRLRKGLYFYYMLWKVKVIETVCQNQMVAWLSDNVLVLINVVALRWAQLVLGWVTICTISFNHNTDVLPGRLWVCTGCSEVQQTTTGDERICRIFCRRNTATTQ